MILLEKATVYVNVNVDAEKFLLRFNFPFQSTAQIPLLNTLASKMVKTVAEKQMASNPNAGQDFGMDIGNSKEDGELVSEPFNKYFNVVYDKNKVSRSVNKTMYENLGQDKSMESLKQMTEMGAPIAMNYVINLPRPATKVEGKKVKLSDDKKKVILSLTSEDFFDDPSKFEYTVEY